MADDVVSYSMAATLHQEAKDRGTSPTWVVTKDGSGRPGKLIARLVVERPTSYVLTGNTLAEVYAKLPWGLTHSERRPGDPPEVIEVWCDEDNCAPAEAAR